MKATSSASLAITASLLASGSAKHGPGTGSNCKASPGSPAWPSAAAWATLNETLGGQLIRPAPPGGVCHRGAPNYDADACPAVREGWKTYDFHAADPVSNMWDNWNNYTCLPSPANGTCSGHGYPAFVVNATSTEHVQEGVNFARENNVRLIVKSSGHDFLGRSVAHGALSIWVHNLDSVEYHEGSFKLANSDTVVEGDAVTAGGGAGMYSLYSAAAEHNATVVGGGAKSVSVGGYITGGGHSLLSPKYGLAADNVLQMDVVTPDGELLTVNEDNQPDLFWALRGGGGSTFGVITSVTVKAHPSPRMQHITYVAGINSSSPDTDDVVGWLLSQVPTMMDDGLFGYNWVSFGGAMPVPIPGVPENMAGMLGSIVLYDRDAEDAWAWMSGLNDTLSSKWPGAMVGGGVISYDSWIDWFDVNYDAGSAGGGAVIVSRLVGREAYEGNREALIDAYKSASELTGSATVYTVAGKGVQEAKPRGGGNAVNPGWRKALVHSLASDLQYPFEPAKNKEIVEALDASWDPLRAITPGMGAYLNEASRFDKNPHETYWGANYERLREIKRRVDPGDVFWCDLCVGSERLAESGDGRVCAVDEGRKLEL